VVFNGSFDHAIDDKGRVSIPVRFRDELQRNACEALVITNNFTTGQPCLQLYSPDGWQREIVSRVQNKPHFDPEIEDFLNFIVGSAHEVPIDRAGRILIPPRLRAFAGLEREVTFSGRLGYFQLWSKARFEQVFNASAEMFKDPEFRRKLAL
jgi:MraZ protein